MKKTPLNKVHHDLKAKMMDFAGWELLVWYTSILEERRTVRSRAGVFDVSDMGRVWVHHWKLVLGGWWDLIKGTSGSTLLPGGTLSICPWGKGR